MSLTNEEKVIIAQDHLADIERTVRYLVISTEEELEARKEMGTEEIILSFISDQQTKISLLEDMIQELSSVL